MSNKAIKTKQVTKYQCPVCQRWHDTRHAAAVCCSLLAGVDVLQVTLGAHEGVLVRVPGTGIPGMRCIQPELKADALVGNNKDRHLVGEAWVSMNNNELHFNLVCGMNDIDETGTLLSLVGTWCAAVKAAVKDALDLKKTREENQR